MCRGPELLYECGHPTGLVKYLYCDREKLAVKHGREIGLCDQCPDYERGGPPEYRDFKCDHCIKEDRRREEAQRTGVEYVPRPPPLKPSETFKKAVDGGKNIARRLTGGLKQSFTDTLKRTRAGTMNLVRNHQEYWETGQNRRPSLPTERERQADAP
ncbi:hypothetical protein DL98DRAFT_597526 [Cadophora sp. DSE1049]|nr:hypothetical protein DL98DRAFT_597526 [Cadophora sp. DSE1049]